MLLMAKCGYYPPCLPLGCPSSTWKADVAISHAGNNQLGRDNDKSPTIHIHFYLFLYIFQFCPPIIITIYTCIYHNMNIRLVVMNLNLIECC